MSSGSSSLPPAALSKAQSQAKIDQIAVRVMNLPDTLRNNPSPVRLNGTVEGQNPDGSTAIRTDQGRIDIQLRDRGTLPQGRRIEIEIPAGKSPQQAAIRASDLPAPPPSMAETVASQNESASQHNQLKQNQKLAIDTLGSVITTTQADEADAFSNPQTTPAIAGGQLLPGQSVRLTPIPPGLLNSTLLNALSAPRPLPDILSQLVSLIESLPKEQLATRTTLITFLSRLDLSPLSQNKAQSGSPLTNQPLTSQSPQSPTGDLMQRIRILVQSIGLQQNFGIDTQEPSSATHLNLINPSRGLDGKILGFLPPSPGQIPTPQTTQTNFFQIPQSLADNILEQSPITLGQVLGTNKEGLPVLSLPLPRTGITQTYSLQFAATNLENGSPVFIAIDPHSLKPTHSLLTQLPDGSVTLTTPPLGTAATLWGDEGSWDSLDTLLQTLTHISPPHGQNLSQMLPHPANPQTMGALSLFFLATLRSGQFENWAGTETANLLKQFGKIDTLRHVTTDLALASRLDSLSLPQEWKMTMLPILWENQVYKAPLYYKHFPEENDQQEAADRKRRKLRFLFDLSMSRMGDVQVDGFMQSERLDIILRTKSPLSQPMQGRMRQLYAGAMDKSRLTGELSFQSRPEQWVDFSKNFEKTGLNA